MYSLHVDDPGTKGISYADDAENCASDEMNCNFIFSSCACRCYKVTFCH